MKSCISGELHEQYILSNTTFPLFLSLAVLGVDLLSSSCISLSPAETTLHVAEISFDHTRLMLRTFLVHFTRTKI